MVILNFGKDAYLKHQSIENNVETLKISTNSSILKIIAKNQSNMIYNKLIFNYYWWCYDYKAQMHGKLFFTYTYYVCLD